MRNNKSIILKITTSHSLIKSILKDTRFLLCFTFIMKSAVTTILNIFSIILLFHDCWSLWLLFMPKLSKDLNEQIGK